MSLTVVVCCSDDFDVAVALDSIDDESVEVVASVTPNRLIEHYLDLRGIRFAVTPRGNHAVTTNAGLELATGNTILIIDSDTYLLPGTLQRVADALTEAPVVNVPIMFADNGRRLSRVIARARTFDNTYDKPAYKPGIAFAKEVRELIGGYWYDPRVAWPCDAEMLGRLRKQKVTISHLPEPGLVHRPNSLRHVLRAYYHYGIGDARRSSLLNQETHWRPTSNLIPRYAPLITGLRDDPGLLAMIAILDSMSLAGIIEDTVGRRGRPRKRGVFSP